MLRNCAIVMIALTLLGIPNASARDATGPLRASLERLLDRLDLSDAKKQEIKTLLTAHKPHVDELVTRETQARESLRDAIERRKNETDEIRDAAAALAVVEHDLALERAEIWDELAPLLGDDQRVKVLRFIVVTESQITSREREAALPVDKIAKTDNLSDEAKAAIDGIVAANKSSVAEEAIALEQSRQTLLILIHQPSIDEGVLARGNEPIGAATAKLALAAGDVWPALLDELEEKQRDSYKKYSAAQDADVVERHRVIALLFLELL